MGAPLGSIVQAPAVEEKRGAGIPQGGNTPWLDSAKDDILWAMNTLLIIVILLLLFGGGGFYIGGPAIGGGGAGLILLICLIIFFCGGFRTKE
jgi:hypothetical protein